MNALVVDRKGLAGKLRGRSKSFILFELIQNAWDENVTKVTVDAHMVPGRAICRVSVEDDCPEGFVDLSSIYTLYKKSKKAPDPTKRGRFELGEKLVIALAQWVKVTTTKGTVAIEGESRKETREKRPAGTLFEAEFKMTRAEFEEMCNQVTMLIAPAGITTTFNGNALASRSPLHMFETTLATVREDAEGTLVGAQRKTTVAVYETTGDEVGHVYELGIPIVPTGDKYHYDVAQRVPMNWERDNVPPKFLKTLRVEVLNAMHATLDKTDATENWVTEALADERCSKAAAGAVLDHRFGERRVIYDPSDAEGTKIAVAEGYTVMSGGSLPPGAWNNVKKHKLALPAGQVTPSPKPYGDDGPPETVIVRSLWTNDMRRMADFARALFQRITGLDLYVKIALEPTLSWSANFGMRTLTLNYGRLGKKWFARSVRDKDVLDLLGHEFAHHTVGDHLSAEYHGTLSHLIGVFTNIALDEPDLFNDAHYEKTATTAARNDRTANG